MPTPTEAQVVSALDDLGYAATKAQFINALENADLLQPVSGHRYAERLLFAPPALSNPIVVNLGTGYQGDPSGASTNTDINFIPSESPRVGGFNLTTGRNVRQIGGRVDYNPSGGSRAHQWYGLSGSAYFEGIAVNLIRQPSDCFSAGGGSGTNPDIYIQNCWGDGLRGDNAGLHPDFLQLGQPIRSLYSHRTTFTTNYQGMFLSAQAAITGEIIIVESNAHCLENAAPNSGYGSAYWFSDSIDQWNNTSHPITVRDVWIAPGPDRTVRDRVTCYAPGYEAGRGVYSSDNISPFVWYPDLYPRLSDGAGGPAKFREGTPPGGDFCPEASVGVGYASPGYR
ncbi:hypothetical protein KY084_01555 [Stakelama sp. CBK3Z-3]|uniref:Right-handed parallel beta-helix repeat-containing protein n=1 Tax=Stakelama flava TaxID=2860338 RepID=A0ABS6XHB0_9SPHN|nr:hypothetical protein [Stakelama flava]MBW4329562.1 hypothetical protein [Stakelama flava]